MIRFVEIYDLKTIQVILEEFDQLFVPPLSTCEELSKLAEKIALKGITFCAVDEDEQICGYISFYANDIIRRQAFVSQIAVKESYRGLNIGTQLLNKCCIISKEKGMISIRLEVNNENQRVISFYEKQGFVKDKKQENINKGIYFIKEL